MPPLAALAIGLIIGFVLGLFAVFAYLSECAEELQARLDAEQARRLQAERPVAVTVFRVPDAPNVLRRAMISAHGQHGMNSETYSEN